MTTELERRLRGHVWQLAGVIGERNVYRFHALRAAEDYIRRTWHDLGYTIAEQSYEVHDLPCRNLEVTINGTVHPDRIVLIGAHYDSVRGAPGANDNASGVAALLELSALLAAAPCACTLRFVAFVNEEPPFFFTRDQGSRLYADAARQRGDNIRLMIALETIGYYRDDPDSQRYPPLFRLFFPDRANFIGLVSNFRSRRMLKRFARQLRGASDVPVKYVATFTRLPGVAWSDHLSFWLNGYRALMVTDTAFYRYPYYHTGGDTPEKLNYDRFAAVTAGLADAVRSMANERI